MLNLIISVLDTEVADSQDKLVEEIGTSVVRTVPGEKESNHSIPY